ncbi:polyphosphate kinase 2 PPK2 [Nonomuraea fuscirosea]|uniref:Polyphosphate kinase 2 PPK2 n=2 Tax=Nonomuraea fuscirosea TaxID=1291556 RepID=A0A2T0MQN2_9ACTN|nr:polyphosphate kinase 2 PPK2 [Nonomuraea fuscirosea]
MDLESITRWEEYSRAKDEMMIHTHIPEAPWYEVESEDKRRARINMISHLLSTIPYREVRRPPLEIPARPESRGYRRPPRVETPVPDVTGGL